MQIQLFSADKMCIEFYILYCKLFAHDGATWKKKNTSPRNNTTDFKGIDTCKECKSA